MGCRDMLGLPKSTRLEPLPGGIALGAPLGAMKTGLDQTPIEANAFAAGRGRLRPVYGSAIAPHNRRAAVRAFLTLRPGNVFG